VTGFVFFCLDRGFEALACADLIRRVVSEGSAIWMNALLKALVILYLLPNNNTP
jgi:hypothetical protein